MRDLFCLVAGCVSVGLSVSQIYWECGGGMGSEGHREAAEDGREVLAQSTTFSTIKLSKCSDDVFFLIFYGQWFVSSLVMHIILASQFVYNLAQIVLL